MKTVAIIQARLGSTRLPHKVLREICGKTMIERVHERVERCETIDQIVIATSTEPSDEVLVEFCKSKNWDYFAGSERDVLSRYVDAANEFDADQIVRITSDCPLLEPSIVDKVVRLLSTDREIDYGCNFFPQRWFPRGLDCEAFTRSMLSRLDLFASESECREHVTLYAYRNNEHFWLASTQASEDFSEFRWTVDTESDLALVREIYQHFGEEPFSWRDIVAAYSQFPHWHNINREVEQKPTSRFPTSQSHLEKLVEPIGKGT